MVGLANEEMGASSGRIYIPDGSGQAKALQAFDYIGDKVIGGGISLGFEYLSSTSAAAAAAAEYGDARWMRELRGRYI